MKEEKYLKETFGTHAGYGVPDGYFDGLQSQILQMLPETEAKIIPLKPRKRSMWRIVAAAACFGAVLFGTGTYIQKASSPSVPKAATLQAGAQESGFDQTADYVMLDNNDIYAYLADNQ